MNFVVLWLFATVFSAKILFFVLPIIVSLYYHTRNNTRVVSVVISTQVGTRQGPRQSNPLLEEPVSLSFTFAAVS